MPRQILYPADALLISDDEIIGLGQQGVDLTPSAGGITYWLRVEFGTDDSAPVTSPYVGEVGQVTLTDTGSIMGVASGEMTPSAQATGAGDPWLREAAGRARITGRTFIARVKRVSAFGSVQLDPVVGWTNTTGAQDFQETTGMLFPNPGGVPLLITDLSGGTPLSPKNLANDTYYRVAVALRSTGSFIFVDDALVWVAVNGSNATVYPHIRSRAAARMPWAVDYVRGIDLGGRFGSEYGLATLHQTSGLSSGTTFTGGADGWHDLYFALPGSPAANDMIELRFNINASTPTLDYNTAYVKRNAGNTAWDFFIDTVVAGTPTNARTVTGVTSPRIIRVKSDGSLRDGYTGTGATVSWTKQGAQVNVSNQNTSVLMATVFTAGQFVPSQLDSFPLTGYSELAAV